MYPYEFKEACENGDIEKVKRMLIEDTENVIDLFAYYSGFIRTCAGGHLDISKLLVKESPGLNVSIYEDLPLNCACRYGHLHIVKWLIENFSVNVHVNEDKPFRTTCEYGHRDIAELLIDTYPDINIRSFGDKPLILASKNGHLDVVKLLISKDSNMNDADAFLAACRKSKYDVVFYLYTVSKNKEQLMELITPDPNFESPYEVARFALIQYIIAAKRIKRAWMKCYYSPYTKIGIKRLNREYDALVEEGIISS